MMLNSFKNPIEKVAEELSKRLRIKGYCACVTGSGIDIYRLGDRKAFKNLKAVVNSKNYIDWGGNENLKPILEKFILDTLEEIEEMEMSLSEEKIEEVRNTWFVLYGCGDERSDKYGWTTFSKEEKTRSEALKYGTAAAKQLGERNYNNYFCVKRTYITDSVDAFRKKCINTAGFTPKF
nr:MAG TPA: hypothetical protein [Caudoviricetes sp.]